MRGRRRWTEHIADYRAADDDYFRARADDLVDLRDRVLRNLLGGDAATVGAGVGEEPVLLAMQEMTPSQFVETDWRGVAGVALAQGSLQPCGDAGARPGRAHADRAGR